MSQTRSSRSVRWCLHLATAPQDVFEALATDAGRGTFWAESTHEADGRITFNFIGAPPHVGRVVHSEPPSKFTLEYYGATTTFALASNGTGGTDLELLATGVEPEEYEETLAGWVSVLLALKATLDFGVDLRNHDPSRTWQHGYADN